MEEKYTYGLWGAALGAVLTIAVGFSWLGYGGGWYTAGGVERYAQSAVQAALLPASVKEVMADTAASAELKTKRPFDFDDVVRDFFKRQREKDKSVPDLGYQFNRACGAAIANVVEKSATVK